MDKENGKMITKYPHMLLDWHFDCNTGKLTCELEDGNLIYEAHAGGYEGYTKTYNDVVTTIANKEWDSEKFWIMQEFDDKYGYFQPDPARTLMEPTTGEREGRKEGVGLEGEYVDHLQRSKYLLDGLDTAAIVCQENLRAHIDTHSPQFATPDCGLTIYKMLPTQKSFYYSPDQLIFDKDNETFDKLESWHSSMPCQMLPYIKSYILSDYKEMAIAGFSVSTIETCKRGEWEAPARPELQTHFTYPTENTHPLTAENINNLDNG